MIYDSQTFRVPVLLFNMFSEYIWWQWDLVKCHSSSLLFFCIYIYLLNFDVITLIALIGNSFKTLFVVSEMYSSD